MTGKRVPLKNAHVVFRCSGEQRALFERAAKIEKMRLTTWARERLFEAAAEATAPRPRPQVPTPPARIA